MPSSDDKPFDPEDFDPEGFAEEIEKAKTGARKWCIRAKQCSRKMTCEHAQIREVTSEAVDLFVGRESNLGDCANWLARKELNTGLDILRRPAGTQRHNSHAGRLQAQRALLRKLEAGEPIPATPYSRDELRVMLITSIAHLEAKVKP